MLARGRAGAAAHRPCRRRASFLLRPQMATTWQAPPHAAAIASSVASIAPMPSPPPAPRRRVTEPDTPRHVAHNCSFEPAEAAPCPSTSMRSGAPTRSPGWGAATCSRAEYGCTVLERKRLQALRTAGAPARSACQSPSQFQISPCHITQGPASLAPPAPRAAADGRPARPPRRLCRATPGRPGSSGPAPTSSTAGRCWAMPRRLRSTCCGARFSLNAGRMGSPCMVTCARATAPPVAPGRTPGERPRPPAGQKGPDFRGDAFPGARRQAGGCTGGRCVQTQAGCKATGQPFGQQDRRRRAPGRRAGPCAARAAGTSPSARSSGRRRGRTRCCGRW